MFKFIIICVIIGFLLYSYFEKKNFNDFIEEFFDRVLNEYVILKTKYPREIKDLKIEQMTNSISAETDGLPFERYMNESCQREYELGIYKQMDFSEYITSFYQQGRIEDAERLKADEIETNKRRRKENQEKSKELKLQYEKEVKQFFPDCNLENHLFSVHCSPYYGSTYYYWEKNYFSIYVGRGPKTPQKVKKRLFRMLKSRYAKKYPDMIIEYSENSNTIIFKYSKK